MEKMKKVEQAADDFQRLMKNSGKGKIALQQEAVIPTVSETAKSEEKLDKAIQRARTLPTLPVSTKYNNVKKVDGMPPCTREWVDNQFGAIQTYALKHLTNMDVVCLDREVFRELKGSMTTHTLVKIIQVAYCLQISDGIRVFADPSSLKPTYLASLPTPLSSMSEFTILELGKSGIIREIGSTISDLSTFKLATTFSYLCCSYLRLLGKDYKTFLRAQKRIIDGYTSFYGHPLQVEDPALGEEAARMIKEQFNNRSDLKDMLYLMLYAGNVTEVGRNLKFTYQIRRTSIVHFVSRYNRCFAYKQNHTVRMYECQFFSKQLDGIMGIYDNLLGSTEENKILQMWVYGRIFDHKFLSMLQTKYCLEFVGTLAHILHKVQPSIHESILNITALTLLGERNSRTCSVWAEKIVKVVTKKVPPWDLKIEGSFILHYTYSVYYNETGELASEKAWKWRFDKRSYLTNIPEKNLPLPPAGVPETTVTMIKMLNEASANLPNWEST